MQPDLEDALVPVKWAEAQIPVFRQRFITWQRSHPYELVMEPDPDAPEWEFLTAYLRTPIDPILVGCAGAIINSARTALDMLWMLLIRRHGKKPKGNTGFPIRDTAAHFDTAADVLKLEYGGTDTEVAAIKKTRTYKGGNNHLYPLHHLDIERKHHRILVLEPDIEVMHITLLNGHLYADFRWLQDKTITHRIPTRAHFRPSHGNALLSAQVLLNEPAFLLAKQPAHLVLGWFTGTVRTIIENFP